MSVEKRSFRELGTLSVTMSIVGVCSILFFWLFPQDTTSKEELIIFTIITMIVVAVLLTVGFTMGWPLIRIDKKGVSKTLFGKTKKYTWDEIVDIRVIRTSTSEWMFFSKSDLKNKGIGRARLTKGVMFVLLNDEKKDITKLIPKDKKIRY